MYILLYVLCVILVTFPYPTGCPSYASMLLKMRYSGRPLFSTVSFRAIWNQTSTLVLATHYIFIYSNMLTHLLLIFPKRCGGQIRLLYVGWRCWEKFLIAAWLQPQPSIGHGRDAAKGAYHSAMYITVILFLTTIYDKKYAIDRSYHVISHRMP